MVISRSTPLCVIEDMLLEMQIPKWPDDFYTYLNVQTAHLKLLQNVLKSLPTIETYGDGINGIVTAGGGPKHFPCLYILLTRLRELGCKLPIEVWYLGHGDMDVEMTKLLEPFDIDLRNGRHFGPRRILNGWELKPHAIAHSKFTDVLWLDADSFPLVDPSLLFNSQQYKDYNCIFWPDFPSWTWRPMQYKVIGIEPDPQRYSPIERGRDEDAFGKAIDQTIRPPIESGEMMINRQRYEAQLRVVQHLCDHSEYWFRHFHGDKDMFDIAWTLTGAPMQMPMYWPNWTLHTMVQHDFDGKPMFHHRTQDKEFMRDCGLEGERRLKDIFVELGKRWNGQVWPSKVPEIAGFYEYERVKYDTRILELLPNGSIGEGRGFREHKWSYECDELLIVGEDEQITCRLAPNAWGWKGRWLAFERMDIWLTPLASRIEPNSKLMQQHSGTYELTRKSRACDPDARHIFDQREWMLKPNGEIAGPIMPDERTWDIIDVYGQLLLTIYGLNHRPTAHLTQSLKDDIWRGRYIRGTRCPIELVRCAENSVDQYLNLSTR